jgi:hypothetical protein
VGELRRTPSEKLSCLNGQQVRAQAVDLREHSGLPGGGQAVRRGLQAAARRRRSAPPADSPHRAARGHSRRPAPPPTTAAAMSRAPRGTCAGTLADGRRWLEPALSEPGISGGAFRSRMLKSAGWMAFGTGDGERAEAQFREALDIARRCGDVDLEAAAPPLVGVMLRGKGELAPARAFSRRPRRVGARSTMIGILHSAGKQCLSLMPVSVLGDWTAAVVGRAFGEWKVNMPSSSVSGCRQYIAVGVDELDGALARQPGSVKHVKQRALRALAEPGYRTILKWTS